LSFITSTIARLKETTVSGSYPAFSTSVRIVVILSIRPGWLPGALDSHDVERTADVSGDEERALSTDSAPHARRCRAVPADDAEEPVDRAHPWFGCSVPGPSA